MTTRTDFYLGSGPRAQWQGSLMFACHPDNLLKDPAGRKALIAVTASRYACAVEELLAMWSIRHLGAVFPPEHGWPWMWETSHRHDWIITFIGGPDGGVHMTAGGGERWHHLDPDNPRPPLQCGPPDVAAWLTEPAAPPAVALPVYRNPTTPTAESVRADSGAGGCRLLKGQMPR